MATTKKNSTTTKPTAKRNTTKKAPAAPVMQSFVLAKDTPPFFSFRITHQTVYWAVLSGLIFVLGIWVIMLNVKINAIYDDFQAQNTVDDTPVVKPKN